jgi:NAD(P)-dependent dehydrogenase (short-subunit alcohol dehydrogenase family)
MFGEAGHADYSSSKSALHTGFIKSVKNEIVRISHNGRINVVAPNWTVTPMAEKVLEDKELGTIRGWCNLGVGSVHGWNNMIPPPP